MHVQHFALKADIQIDMSKILLPTLASACSRQMPCTAHCAGVLMIWCGVQGRVIGVNTAIFTNTGTSAGVGFAIPIDIVRSVVPQLIQYGKVVRPALNIQVCALPYGTTLGILSLDCGHVMAVTCCTKCTQCGRQLKQLVVAASQMTGAALQLHSMFAPGENNNASFVG